MPIPQSVLLTMSQRMKEGKRKVARDLDQTLKTSVFPALGIAGAAINMQNDQSNDPNVRTAAISGAVRDGSMGYQSGGIGGLLAGGITGGISSALVAMNRKEQNYEADQNKYLNDMYGSVVGDDMNLASLVNAAKGGEINSAEGDQYVPIQTEAKKVGRKLIKEKLVFADGTMSDVNATKPHSEMKKDEVTDIVTQGTYVFPVNTKITQKDLDFLITYTTGDYSENGKNFAVEEFTLRDILGKNFEGSFAEAAHIIDKKYPVADTEDSLDPVTRITNSENIVNRSKIIAHLIRLNESKIKGIKLEENKIRPEMNAKRGGFVKKYPDGGKIDPRPKRKPIGVEPGDPRIKDYKDSLNLYNKGLLGKKEFLNLLAENNINPNLIDTGRDLKLKDKIKPISNKTVVHAGSYLARNTDGTLLRHGRMFEGVDQEMGLVNIEESSPLMKKIDKGFFNYKKPVQPYVAEKPTPRPQVNVAPLPGRENQPLDIPEREVNIRDTYDYNWGDKEMIQDAPGIPNIKIVQKHRKSDDQLLPAYYENEAGERIPYNEKLTKEFQYKKQSKKMGGYVKSYKKGGTVIDPAKMKAEIQKINEERNNPSRTVPLVSVTPTPNRTVPVSAARATSQDDYMIQNLKGMGMYNTNVDITRPNVGYSFWNTPTQKQNAIVNGPIGSAPVVSTKTTAPVSKGTGTGTGTKNGGGSGGSGSKDWKDKAVTERWQKKLKEAGLYKDGKIDGMWGPKTNKAYQEYLDRNKKGSTTTPVAPVVPPVVPPVAPKSISYAPGESTIKYTATDYNPTNNSNAAAPVSYFEQKGMPYTEVPDAVALKNANEMNATALTFAFPWLGYGQKGAAAATTGRQIAKIGGKEVVKATASVGGKEMIKGQTATNFARLGSGASKGAGSFKNAATGAKAAMDSGALRSSVESIRNGILHARKTGNRAEVQKLMKTLQQLRKSNPSAGIYKKGGYVMKMAIGGGVDPKPKGKMYKRKNEQGQEEEVLIGDDQNLYLKNKDGVYEKKDKRLYDSFMNVIGGADREGWSMLSNDSDSSSDIKKKDSAPISAWSDGAPEFDPGVTGDLTGIPKSQQMFGTFPTGDKKSAWSDGAPEYDPTLTMDVQPKYQEMFGSFPSVYDMGPIDTTTDGGNTNPVASNTTTNTNSNTNTSDVNDLLDKHRDLIDQRSADAHRDALDAKNNYRDLAARTGARDLMGAVGGIFALGLQNRKEPRAFKRPRFMAERYRGLSPQQINQEAESTTGAGVEAVKQMNRESGSMTSRLGSALMSRLTEQQGHIRKQYVDQNTSLERAKYNEYAAIQDFNVGEEARAKRVEIDNGNKVIAGTQGIISKYLGSRNEADMANVSINRQIDLDLKGDIYTLSNQRLGIDVMGMDYDQQIREIDLKKSQIEAELQNINIGEEERKKYEDALKTIKALEERVAQDDLKNKKK